MSLYSVFSLSTSDLLQPYRTTPLVLPHAKTIHDVGEQGNKFLTPSRQTDSAAATVRN